MPFKIAPFPGQTYSRPYADHSDIRAYLGFAELVERKMRLYNPNEDLFYDERYTTLKARKLPLDFCESAVVVPLTDHRSTVIYCKPGNPSPNGQRGKSSAHRVFAMCPDCGEAVPAGRTHQHKCKLTID